MKKIGHRFDAKMVHLFFHFACRMGFFGAENFRPKWRTEIFIGGPTSDQEFSRAEKLVLKFSLHTKRLWNWPKIDVKEIGHRTVKIRLSRGLKLTTLTERIQDRDGP